jgi:hypothetical protein
LLFEQNPYGKLILRGLLQRREKRTAVESSPSLLKTFVKTAIRSSITDGGKPGTNLTICGNLSDPRAEWEVIGEVFCIADSLSENARLRSHVHTPAAFPLNNLQVCIA